jgi:hypothetical protein
LHWCLQAGGLQAWSTDFGSGVALIALGAYRLGAYRLDPLIWIWGRIHLTGAYRLGAYGLGAYRLGPPVLDLESHYLAFRNNIENPST